MKEILIITGSPRKGGNSDRMAWAFAEGAREKGHAVSFFEAGKKEVLACIGCNTCFTKGQACSFDDDFREMAPLLEKADVVVFCTPLYYYSFPGKMKTALDKIYAFLVGKRDLRGKECLLLACGYGHRENEFDALSLLYDLIWQGLGWKDLGRLLVRKALRLGDIEKTDGLVKAKEMGRRIS
ncbi:MAG: flavodoxin family protein [Fusobacteriaceae bacterium]|jgi:multimeric flavodoxin WrbA|nr:flavodoxin family protein [Fusobacteriaceae bacterium]